MMNNNCNNTVKCSESKKSDFSIEHILTKAGNKNESESLEYQNMQNDRLLAFSWLNCTRYCPPKLPRTQKKEGPQKRQLGRHPRIPFSSHQLAVLEDKFRQSNYLGSSEVSQLSKRLQLADIRVKIWFQNRRARDRREKQEQEIQLKPYRKENKQITNNSSTETSITSVPPRNMENIIFHPSTQIFTNTSLSVPTYNCVSNDNKNFTYSRTFIKHQS